VDEGAASTTGPNSGASLNTRVGWHYDPEQNPAYEGRLDRIGLKQSEFRALYRVTDTEVSGSNPAMTAMILFGHTVPLHEQVHFPAPVQAPPLTSGRSQVSSCSFTWVERRQEEAFMANGRCTMVE
jgi:hypothetical protein